MTYTVGYEELYINGVLQVRGSDYVATTGNTITGMLALSAGDTVTVMSQVAYSIGDTYTQAAADSRFVNKSVGGLNLVIPTSVNVGSGTGSVAAQGGITFSGASSVSLNGCFTSTYKHYVIMYDSSAGGSNTYFRLRQAGSDDSLSTYEYAVFSIYSAPGSGVNQYSGNNNIAELNQTYGPTQITMYNPQLAVNTRWHFNASVNYSTGGAGAQLGGGYKKDSKQYDGFTLYCGAAMTGTMAVYGYNNGGA